MLKLSFVEVLSSIPIDNNMIVSWRIEDCYASNPLLWKAHHNPYLLCDRPSQNQEVSCLLDRAKAVDFENIKIVQDFVLQNKTYLGGVDDT